MVTALYRRYRPETFSELIGQSQVTDPLRTALRADRVGHAYLFSGPRGCGKTTSARILARCLNCAQGPTDEPCGVCASCVELARDGGGSLDVIEIDAASHNGVDDARDLRDRAAFAPARDRFKIFILDEAHMVTTQGFNALLKLVEEPPDHVKFIFATTEPDKVIGTIRSRTHHYPFRLVPPALMLEYVQQLAEAEGVAVQPGVLPLVVRAGGGSVRDTLSLLDQLMAGSEDATLSYERAVALLGYTHAALLDEVVDALGQHDASGAFAAIDRVVQTGQDPRRFVEDLLERLRDLIVVAATREQAAAVLRGIPQDELERMSQQASAFGTAELSRAADIANQALTEMTGATSPRLHLELMVARLLVPAADAGERGTIARVERLERRIGIDEPSIATAPPASAAPPSRPPSPTPSVEPAPPIAEESAPEPEDVEPPIVLEPDAAPPLSLQQVRDAWPEVLEAVQRRKRSAWMVVATAQARDLVGDVLTLAFPSETDAGGFRGTPGPDSASEHLRAAIQEVLGVRVKFLARVTGPERIDGVVAPRREPVTESALAAESGWHVAPIPTGDVAPAGEAAASGSGTPAEPDAPDEPVDAIEPEPAEPAAPEPEPVDSVVPEPEPDPEPEPAPAASDPVTPAPAREPAPASAARSRYGEAVVRELLQANFLEETAVAPRVRPVPSDAADRPADPES